MHSKVGLIGLVLQNYQTVEKCEAKLLLNE